ncbi:MAG TPA: hypothetical protein VFR68_09450 [Candidatus Dormibacteraeota bacterium]|nr:hypothetical protein [Candidatus Dormibacteraeota bacterium]
MIKLPIAALVVVVALLGGFYGGYKIGGGGTAAAASSTGTNSKNSTGFTGGGRQFAACPTASNAASAAPSGAVRRGASGTVTNLTSNSLTLHDARCNTDVKVTFDQSVIIRKMVLGQASDLQESQTVTVAGTRQADGSVKANSITIVPAGSAGGFFGGAGGGTNGG